MNFKVWLQILCATTLVAVIAGCETMETEPAQSPELPAATDEKRADQITGDNPSGYKLSVERTFSEGLRAYENGDYPAAIRLFNSPEIRASWPELQVRALKQLAFSYCVTRQLEACRKAFGEALLLYPGFRLTSSEAGHPIWGPVFDQARADPQKAATGRAD